jgi:hypothetical protein
MKNKTVVEWLVDQVNTDCLDPIYIRKELIEQANAMFEKQIVNAYKQGQYDSEPIRKTDAEQYYNETYKGEHNE